jgi:hypothetical protein
MYRPTDEDFLMALSPQKTIYILFVGAGAVGCFYASRLHHVCMPQACLQAYMK